MLSREVPRSVSSLEAQLGAFRIKRTYFGHGGWGGNSVMEYVILRSDKTGYGIAKSVIFAKGINGIRDI